MADVYVNALTTISTEPTTTDSLVAVNRNTNEGKIIDYNLLADVILNKIASKQFSGLNTTSKLLVGAINELDSDVSLLNSNFAEPPLLLNQNNLSSTATSYACDWSGYRFLLICATQYASITETVLVPVGYFSATTANARVRVHDSLYTIDYQIYKNDTSSVYITSNKTTDIDKYYIRIYGIK